MIGFPCLVCWVSFTMAGAPNRLFWVDRPSGQRGRLFWLNPRKAKHTSEFMDGAASRNYVIDEQNMLVIHRFRHRKGVSYILFTFFGRQICLGSSSAHAFAAGGIKLDPKLCGYRSGKFLPTGYNPWQSTFYSAMAQG